MAGPRLFTSEEESLHFRDREALFKVIPVDGGEAVVEVFPLYATGIAVLAPPTGAPQGPRRSLVAVELAAPLEVRDLSVIWRVRRNLLINSSGAVALLAAAMATGFGFRTYIRGRRLEEQLVIAREVQTELLPAATESWKEVGLSTVYQPADQVSGDFYDGFRVGDGRIALVMGDVSGKGVPAALVMGVIHGAVRSSTWTGSAVDHERESRRLNELLCEKSSGARFASMFWGYYDSPTRQLCYVNAGHCPALLAGERDGRIEVTRLPATGTVLGLLPGATYQQAACDVRPGDVLVLYSDGVVEAATSADEEYGESRLREALVAAGSAGPEDVRDGILASVGAFIGATALRDDLTLVVAKLA
jgi:sigma-B regulation protein RsbU (phosphoserine phosphatase)